MAKKLIYIAGALNDDACGYIQNIHKMIKYAEEVRKLGACVSVPCNDFIHGVICGDHEYKDYFENNLEILKRCDAIALVPGWEKSKGVAKEMEVAVTKGIPVLMYIDEVMEYLSESNKMYI